MPELNTTEVVCYLILVICNCLITSKWAKYGVIDYGIKRPIDNSVPMAMLVGMGTLLYAGYMQRDHGLIIHLMQKHYQVYGILIILGIPVLWLYLCRAALPPGMFDYNRAKVRTIFWMPTYYREGKVLLVEGNQLREFGRAQEALRFFEQALAAQRRLDADPQVVYNLASILQEFAILRRMMNLFEEALEALREAEGLVDRLLTIDRSSAEALSLLSIVLYRQAEIHHAQGNREKALAGYRASLDIDRQLGDERGMAVLQKLIAELS